MFLQRVPNALAILCVEVDRVRTWVIEHPRIQEVSKLLACLSNFHTKFVFYLI